MVLDSPFTGCNAVSVAASSNNADIAVSPSNRSFSASTPSQAWNVPQTFTVTAAQDADNTHDTATISHSILLNCDADGYTASLSLPSLTVNVNDDEAPRAAIASTNPASLTEAALSGGTVTVTVALTNATFASGVTASSFELVTNIPNVSVSQVSGGGMGTTSATLTLAFTGDFSAVETLAVRVLAAAHSGSDDVTTGTVDVTAAAGVTLSTDRLALNEPPNAGSSGTYTVVLDSPFTGCNAVSVAASSNNADVAVSPSNRGFSASTPSQAWNRPQTFTVTVSADADSSPDTATISHRILLNCDADGYTTSLSLPSLTVTVNDADVGATIAPGPAALTESNLHGATLTLTLDNTTFAAGAQAAGAGAFALVSTITGLTIAQVSGVTSGGTTATLTLGFTGDFRGQPTLAVRVPATTHAGTGALTSNAVAVTADAGVTVSESSLSLDEDPGTGGSAHEGTYTVVLDSPPTGCALVRIDVASSHAGVTVSPAMLTFRRSAMTQLWNAPQTVTVTAGQDDDGADVAATVSHSVGLGCSAAGYLPGMALPGVSVVVSDDEAPGVVIDADPSSPATDEAGPLALTEGHATQASGSFTVRLAAAPTQDVTVTVASADTGAVTLDDTDGDTSNGVQDTLTFTAGDWGTAQTVTARAVDDADAGNESVALTATAATATASEYDDGAGTRLSASLTVTVADDDALAAPGSVAVTAQVRALRVQWNAVTGADGYKVQWRSGGQGYTAGREESATGTSHTVTGLVAGTQYTLRVLPTRTGANDGPASAEATGTPLALPTLAVDSPSVTEGTGGTAGTLTFTVTLSHASQEQVTVGYADAGSGTATSGTDYTALAAGTLTFAAGTTTQTFDVALTGDATDEDNETVAVTLSGPTNATLGTATGTGTVTDDDDPPTVSIDSPTAAEGTGETGGTLTFTVTLSAASGKQVTVAYADAGSGTATSGTDYTALAAGTLTFTPGTTTQTIDVALTGDATDEDNETVAVTLSAPTNATLAIATGTGTLTDDDDPPTLSIDSPSAAEGTGATGGTLTFTVSLSAASGKQVTVAYADAGSGTATSGTDYTALAGGTLTFAAGTTTQTVDVTLTGDALDEANETIDVTLSGPTNATIPSGDETGTGTIADDDATPALSIDSPTVTEGDTGTATLTFTVRLGAASARQVTVGYADAGTGTATSGTDYTALAAGTLTFTPGTTSRTIAVTVTGDTVDEADETVEVTLSSPTQAVIPQGTGTGTGTITDDDDPPTLSIDSPSATEGTGATGDTLTFTVTLSAASGQDVTVAYARTGGTATAGAAGDAGVDYTAFDAGTLTFAAGTTTQTLDVALAGDATDEADETIEVTLSGPTNATLATAMGTGTITDDDDAPTVSIDSPTVAEGTGETGGTLTFTVTLSAASGREVTVAYADAGSGTATSGTDYTALAGGTLTFAAGETAKTIAVTVAGDATDEASETVAVTLSSPTNATLAAGATTGTGTVTDDDDPPVVSIDAPNVVEGAAGATPALRFTVTLSAASGRQVTVAYADAGSGTATSGTDYTALAAGTLTFAAGTTTRTIDVTVAGDATDEANETVDVTLSAPVNATLASGAGTGTGTIVDDDGAPVLTIDSPSVAEGTGSAATLRFTVTLSPASAQQVTVAYRDTGTGTATAGAAGAPGADYTTFTAGMLTFAAGTTTQTIDVTVAGDALDEANETVDVALSAPNNATLGLAAGTGTITDDDATPTVSIDSPTVAEGTGATAGTLTFTVSLSAASGQAVTVGYARTGGTATAGVRGAAGVDYTALPPGTLTFPAGTTSRTIAGALAGDTADEPSETVVVTLSAPANATVATGTGTGTITDDDDAPTVSIDHPRVAEGAAGTAAPLRFTVSLSAASGRTVTVAYRDAGTGTATSGTDYAALGAGTLTFAPGTTAQAIDVSVTGDSANEPDETVAVSLSAPVNATLATGAATGTGTIADDDARPVLSIDSPRVVEGGSGTTATLRFTVTLSAASGQPVTVAYRDAGTGTATSGTDYAALAPGTLTFAPGTTVQTIDVSVAGDVLDEVDETVVVTLSAPVNAGLGTARGTGTVIDDDGSPALSIDSPRVAEGDGGTVTLRFTVSLSLASAQPVAVSYRDAGTGTATSGTDYTAIAPGTLTFAPGTTAQIVEVSVIGDTQDEADETVVVALHTPVEAVVAVATGTGTIVDDDAPAPPGPVSLPVLSIDSPRVAEGGVGETAALRFTVSLSRTSTRPVTVAYRDAGTGTATAGVDYTALAPGTLTFAPGTRTQVIAVSVIGDADDEPDETVGVALRGPTNATLASGAATGTGTIVDDDEAGTGRRVETAGPGTTVREVDGHTVTVVVAEGVPSGVALVLPPVLDRAVTVRFAPPAAGVPLESARFGLGESPDRRTVVDVSAVPVPSGGVALCLPVAAALRAEAGARALRLLRWGASAWAPVAGSRDDVPGGQVCASGVTALSPFAVGYDDRRPTFGEAAIAPQRWVQDMVIAPLTLPAATGGDGPLTYTLAGPGPSGALPEGLFYTPPAGAGDPATGGTLTGRPAVAVEEAAWTLTVTDTDGDTATLTFTVEVEPDWIPDFGDVQVPAQRYVEGTAIAPLALPAATGGNLPLTYALTGPGPAGTPPEGLTLPAGLRWTGRTGTTGGCAGDGVAEAASAVPGALTGTPAEPAAPATYTLTVWDRDCDTATLTFTVAVEPDLTPTFGAAQVPAQRYVQNRAIAPLTLPAATGGNGPLTYTLAGPGPEGALPEGLVYTPPGDPATGGALTGTPAVAVEASTWTLTVTDLDGDTATLTFTVEVEADLMPTFGTAAIAPQRYVQDVAIAPLVLPAATGGDGTLTYTLTGPGPASLALPEGLAWSGSAAVRPLRPGTLTGTPTVPAPPATWTLAAIDADGDRATLPFTIEVLDRLRERLKHLHATLLPDLSRAMTASTVDAVAGRIGQALAPHGAAAPAAMASAEMLAALAGLLQANEAAIEDGTWSWKQGLDGRTFALALSGGASDAGSATVAGIAALNAGDGGGSAGAGTGIGISAFTGAAGAAPDAIPAADLALATGTTGAAPSSGLAAGVGPAPSPGARVTLWGAGDYRSLAGGRGSGVDWNGHLFGAHLGLDARFGSGGLAGLALSVTEGRFDYTDTSALALGQTVEGDYESRMTSAHPYVGWAWPSGTHAWASVGYGAGDVTLTDGEAGRQEGSSTLHSAAAGGSVRVVSGAGPGVLGPLTVDLKGEAWAARLEVEDNGDRIAGLAVRTHRLRVSAEGARAFTLTGGGAFTPSVEVGVRLDGGDGETGAGVELGGGLDYAHPALGLSAHVSGRALLAHEHGREDWSVGGALSLAPASGRGLSLRVAPSYGDTGSGLARLWEEGVTGAGATATGAAGASVSNGQSPAARLDAEMGYGLAALAGTLTPYGGLALSEGGARGYRLGARFGFGPDFELGLEGERRESRTERAGHGLMLRGRMRW